MTNTWFTSTDGLVGVAACVLGMLVLLVMAVLPLLEWVGDHRARRPAVLPDHRLSSPCGRSVF